MLLGGWQIFMVASFGFTHQPQSLPPPPPPSPPPPFTHSHRGDRRRRGRPSEAHWVEFGTVFRLFPSLSRCATARTEKRFKCSTSRLGPPRQLLRGAATAQGFYFPLSHHLLSTCHVRRCSAAPRTPTNTTQPRAHGYAYIYRCMYTYMYCVCMCVRIDLKKVARCKEQGRQAHPCSHEPPLLQLRQLRRRDQPLLRRPRGQRLFSNLDQRFYYSG
jgi:hypothetical protein